MKNKHFLRSMGLAILFAASCLVSLGSVNAQSDLADEDRATILFDIRMGKMLDGEFMQELAPELEELRDMSADQTDFDPETVVRIFGAANMPDSMDEFNQPEPPESLQFFLRMEMTDIESAQNLLETMNGEEVELNGQTYISPQDGIYAHLIEDENTIEVGTEMYLTQATRRLFTKGLDDAFKKTPDFGIRIVADLAAESDLISEAVETAKAEGEPMMAPMLDLIDNASDLSICIDFDSENLISIAATGNNEEDAEALRGGLDGLLGMAKMFGAPQADQIPDADMAEMTKDFLESLAATRDGLSVRIDIPRPEGFEKAIRQALEAVPMMMGGGGGFGPDF